MLKPRSGKTEKLIPLENQPNEEFGFLCLWQTISALERGKGVFFAFICDLRHYFIFNPFLRIVRQNGKNCLKSALKTSFKPNNSNFTYWYHKQFGSAGRIGLPFSEGLLFSVSNLPSQLLKEL